MAIRKNFLKKKKNLHLIVHGPLDEHKYSRKPYKRRKKKKKKILISLQDFEHFREQSITVPQRPGNYVNLPQGWAVSEGGSHRAAFHRSMPIKAGGAFPPHTGYSD